MKSIFTTLFGYLKGGCASFYVGVHSRSIILSKDLEASFITSILEKPGADRIKDFRPISLLSSILENLAKVLAGRLKVIFRGIISPTQGAFVKGRQILDGVLVADECIHSRYRDKIPGHVCKLELVESL